MENELNIKFFDPLHQKTVEETVEEKVKERQLRQKVITVISLALIAFGFIWWYFTIQ